jgi:very-short-patch-repair endonuclease
VTHPEHDPALRDRLIRLMGVLRQLAVAKSRPIRDVAEYHQMVPLDEYREYVTIDSSAGPGERILGVQRVVEEAQPGCPGELEGLARYEAGSLVEPVLRIPASEPPEDTTRLTALFEEWQRKWRAWAERERLWRPRRQLFEQFFELQQKHNDRPESVELVLAAGLLHVPHAESERAIRVHLLTQPVRVERDAASGDMTCVLVEDEQPRLEDDEILSKLPLFDPSGSVSLRERLVESADTLLDPGLQPYLKEWAERALRVEHTVSESWELPDGAGTQLVYAPALVARRRNVFALRSYYETIARSLEDESSPIPLGLAQLVEAIEPSERLAWLERTAGAAFAGSREEPLFPLPANEEQAQIIRRLDYDNGVVVEGPPGTGKTHTIANLVSALLARGQRILVTSEKAQALRVLRDKLPPEMQELCVSITDATAKSNSDLTRSVATLAAAKTDFNPERADREIAELASRRDAAKRARAKTLEKIRAIRESETFRHPRVADGFSGTLAEIAREIVNTAERDGWIPGEVHGGLPLDAMEFTDLLDLSRTVDEARLHRRHQRLPESASLPQDTTVAQLADAVARGNAAKTGETGQLVHTLSALPGDALLRLQPACDRVSETLAALRNSPTNIEWAVAMTDQLLHGTNLHLWQRAANQLELVDVAIDHDTHLGLVPVAVDPSVNPTAAAIYERFGKILADGGSVRRYFKSELQKQVDAFGECVTVDGSIVRTADSAFAAGRHLRIMEAARTLAAAFAPLDVNFELATDRGVLTERMRQLKDCCDRVSSAILARQELDNVLAFLPSQQRPHLDSIAALERVAMTTMAVSATHTGALSKAQLNSLAEALLTTIPPAARSTELDAAVRALRAADGRAYVDALRAIERARFEQHQQRRCDELMTQLRAAAPKLASAVEQTARNEEWADRIERWPQAWAHARGASWLVKQTAPGYEQRLESELEVVTNELALATAKLAAAKAWQTCLRRMTAVEVQALQSYRSSMSHVGKGSGKYAERFRAAARDAMAIAQRAVPAWVMPIQQVLASIPAQLNSFDVVIVDEASQAELTSSFLLALAPRVIVVGDDKQCTPSEIASGSLEPIFDRLDTELADIPRYLRTEFTPRSSIFSMLRSRFGQVVRLREHFRCMPEIINWSSNEFYRDAPLIPVRQFGSDRLSPLRTSHVEGGYVEGRNATLVNRPEAEAIANSIAACIEDPAYADRTFGVVVLQGQSQVDLIQNELLRLVYTDEWTKRRLRVGTPPDFQGDERHVVWLSLVVGPEQNFMALTRDEFRRRFNVAASRAQDQLWLFHSVTADRLRPTDLRHSLLTYMLAADSAQLALMLNDVTSDERHERFDSLFEQRIFLDLLARGYHVTPQVETNGRRIDLVVTGAAGKLAVECDGDAFHTSPEQREADLHREQELKRCGWTFWRVRESAYYLNKEKALASLWTTLDKLNISPFATGAEDKATWAPTSAVDKDPDLEDEIATAAPVVETAPVMPTPVTAERGSQRELILEQAEAGPLTPVDAAQILRVPVFDARDELNVMVASGLLQRVRQHGSTKYTLAGTKRQH